MLKLPRILCAFWGAILLFGLTSFAETLQITAQASFSSSSFFIPLNFAARIGDLSFEHQLDLQHVQFPADRHLIHTYQRKNITMLSEISELRWSNTRHSASIGRNYVHSGPSSRNSGLFSAFAPSLNHVALNLNVFRDWKFEYRLIRLDDRQADVGAYKRWFYYRRLQFSLGEHWKVGLKDAVLATGLQRGIDLAYLNPAAIFQLEQLHGNVEEGTPGQNNDNQLMGLDLEFQCNKSARLYLDAILDEFQIDIADRDHLQDVFGITMGIEFVKHNSQTYIEYWFGSPWLYTNGGMYTNVEVNHIPLGFSSPNAYGISIGWIQDYPKYRTNILVNFHKQGEQTVNTIWNSVDNKVPLLLSKDNWQPELDLRLGFKNKKLLEEIRLTYNLLNSEGFFLILKFKTFDKQWTEKP
jgi:hypothetical protein